MTTATSTLDVDQVRAQFPALRSGYIYGDNAGGSQVAQSVIDRLVDYLSNSNAQLGADYDVSKRSTDRVLQGVLDGVRLFNAESEEEVSTVSSSTLGMEHVARALELGGTLKPDDEIIVTGEHEANGGPWKKLAKRLNLALKFWYPRATNPENPYSVALHIDDLLPLIVPGKTRVVAFTACSNILGSIVDVKTVTARVRELAGPDVIVSVDCVAYAPHRKIDVRAWDVDVCIFSVYKVYGPHIALLYTRRSTILPRLSSLAHHFLPYTAAIKLQPGGPHYENAFAITGVIPYLLSIVGISTPSLEGLPAEKDEEVQQGLIRAFDAIAAHEQTLLEPLLGYLRSKWDRGVRIVGEEHTGTNRVPTVSFLVTGPRAIKSIDVVDAFDAKGGIGIRYGHFYAYTLIATLQPKIDPVHGIIRVSFVHYNTVQEVQRVIEILEEILA